MYMESAQDIFKAFLHKRGYKYTRERREVLEVIESFNRPFEAEELLLALRGQQYRVSKATVYRTLKHLVECLLVNQVFFGTGKQSYYDFLGTQRGHNHLVDVRTGKIIPFSSPEIVVLRDRIAKELGFTSVAHRFQILGQRSETPLNVHGG
ncbi:MAG: transcriptional repressor [Planctomycetes bacterium]|nr:transcriptional repressor [Planctomycetota bacterium]